MNFIAEYGYWSLFGIFFAGMMGVPLAEETVMTFVGTLTTPQGILKFWPTFIAIYVGILLAMTTSYVIGRRLGRPMIFKVGNYVKLKQVHILKTEKWFNQYGLWSICFGYFIPGIRQINGYFAGISKIPFHRYILAAGIGALIWCFTFLTIGQLIGQNYKVILAHVHSYIPYVLIVVFLVSGVLLYRYIRRKRNKTPQ